MSEEQVAAGFEAVVETLDQGAAALFGEIDQHIHAENQVHAADIDGRGEIHLREGDHFLEPRFDLIAAFHLRKVRS